MINEKWEAESSVAIGHNTKETANFFKRYFRLPILASYAINRLTLDERLSALFGDSPEAQEYFHYDYDGGWIEKVENYWMSFFNRKLSTLSLGDAWIVFSYRYETNGDKADYSISYVANVPHPDMRDTYLVFALSPILPSDKTKLKSALPKPALFSDIGNMGVSMEDLMRGRVPEEMEHLHLLPFYAVDETEYKARLQTIYIADSMFARALSHSIQKLEQESKSWSFDPVERLYRDYLILLYSALEIGKPGLSVQKFWELYGDALMKNLQRYPRRNLRKCMLASIGHPLVEHELSMERVVSRIIKSPIPSCEPATPYRGIYFAYPVEDLLQWYRQYG